MAMYHLSVALLQMTEMAIALKNAFKRELTNLDWMDDDTKQAALAKADALTYKIGYPDWMYNKTRMTQEWGDVSDVSSPHT